MTVGRRNHPSYDRNIANTFPYFPMNPLMQASQSGVPAGKAQFGGQFVDEQTVPQALYQPKSDAFKNLQQDSQGMDMINSYNQMYDPQNFSYNTNFLAYPLYQPTNYETASTVQSNQQAPLRQNSIPNGSIDQFLDNSSFDYEQVLANLDLTQYENPGSFNLEDYVPDLENVNDGNMNFGVKEKKTDGNTDKKNLDEIENGNIMNYNDVATDLTTASANNIAHDMMAITNDQTLDEQNLMEIIDFYSSPNWQTPSTYVPTTNQPLAIAGEAVVKSEPTDTVPVCDVPTSSYGIASPLSIPDEGMPSIGLPDDELIQMPVSRFNELLVSLTPEQSNLAKDIRRRGKNKQAARLCRKRKLDNISTLEDTLSQMQEEKVKLLEERKEIVAETTELKSNIDMICEMLMKGLNGQNASELSVLHHSNGQTLLVQK